LQPEVDYTFDLYWKGRDVKILRNLVSIVRKDVMGELVIGEVKQAREVVSGGVEAAGLPLRVGADLVGNHGAGVVPGKA
jgi:hypothetical protein